MEIIFFNEEKQIIQIKCILHISHRISSFQICIQQLLIFIEFLFCRTQCFKDLRIRSEQSKVVSLNSSE